MIQENDGALALHGKIALSVNEKVKRVEVVRILQLEILPISNMGVAFYLTQKGELGVSPITSFKEVAFQ